jgi:hypothetical protein
MGFLFMADSLDRAMSSAHCWALPMNMTGNLTKLDQIPTLMTIPIPPSASNPWYLSINRHY